MFSPTQRIGERQARRAEKLCAKLPSSLRAQDEELIITHEQLLRRDETCPDSPGPLTNVPPATSCAERALLDLLVSV